jgi:hypothetical protein
LFAFVLAWVFGFNLTAQRHQFPAAGVGLRTLAAEYGYVQGA